METFMSYAESKKICTDSNVNSVKEYASFRKDSPQHGLPARPHVFYPEWVSWPNFLGKTSSLKIVRSEARDGESLPGSIVFEGSSCKFLTRGQ